MEVMCKQSMLVLVSQVCLDRHGIADTRIESCTTCDAKPSTNPMSALLRSLVTVSVFHVLEELECSPQGQGRLDTVAVYVPGRSVKAI